MTIRRAVYFATTILTAFCFLTGGAAYLYGVDETVRGMLSLGYPVYFVTILGTWKILGSLAILVPRFPRLKEWAYAGIAFDLIGAALSHLAVGHPAIKAIVPMVLLGIAMTSWALRPANLATAAS